MRGKRWLSIILTLALLLPLVAFAPTASAASGYIIIKATTTMRAQPSDTSASLGNVSRGEVFFTLGPVNSEGGEWFVIWKDGGANAFIFSGQARLMTEAEVTAYTQSGTKPNPDANSGASSSAGTGGADLAVGSYVTNASSSRVNVRANANANSTIVYKAVAGSLMKVTGNATGTDGYKWYKVEVAGKTGYVRYDVVKPTTAPTVTATPGPIVTPEPGQTSNYTSEYLIVVNNLSPLLRDQPPSTAVQIQLEVRWYLKNMNRRVVDTAGYTWYEVGLPLDTAARTNKTLDDGTGYMFGWVRGTNVRPDGVDTGDSVVTADIITVKNASNIYKTNTSYDAYAPDGKAVKGVIPAGTKVKNLGVIKGDLSHGDVSLALSGFTYYKVEITEELSGYGLPAALYLDGGVGWIRSTDASTLPTPTPIPGTVVLPSGQRYVVSVSTTANMRNAANQKATVIAKIPGGTQVAETKTATRGTDGWVWHYVTDGKLSGYMRDDVLTAIINTDPVVTPIPGATATPPPTIVNDYVVALSEHLILWNKPFYMGDTYTTDEEGRYERIPSNPGLPTVNSKGKIQPIQALSVQYAYEYYDADDPNIGSHTATTTVNGKLVAGDVKTKILWYQLSYDGVTGWIQASNVRAATSTELIEAGIISVSATATPTPVEVTPYYVRVGISNAALRSGPSSSSTKITTLSPNSLATYISQVSGTDGYTWYRVRYYSQEGYLRSDVATPVNPNDAGSSTYPTATPPASSGSAYNGSLMAVNSGETNLRSGMGQTFGSIYKMPRGEIVEILGTGIGTDGATWYSVRLLSNNMMGYVMGIYLRALTAAEQAIYGSYGTSSVTPPSTSTTLSYGSTGTAVTNMQNALIALGYLTGSVTLGTFDTATYNAVRKFQQAYGLTVDGVAGSTTLTKIYEAAGGSSGSTSDGTGSSAGYTLGSAELVNWFTGDVKAALERSSTITVVGVESKLAFKAKYRWGTQHADCEPLTANDTAVAWTIRNSSGRKDRVPVWVIAAGRTFASSMYFWEHDTSSDTIKDNNYAGIFCLHFQGSTTHTNTNPSATVNQQHQESVMIAYNAGK